MFKLFFKKEFKTNFTNQIKEGFRHPLSLLVSVVTYLLLMGICLFLFIALIKATETLKISQELLIIALFLGIVVQIINNIMTTTNYLYHNYDHLLLAPLPIKGSTIIGVKMVILFLKELLSTVFMTLPLMLAYGIYLKQGVSYYLVQTFLIFILPIIPLAINVIISMIMVKLKKHLGSFQVIKLISYLIIMIIFFVIYQQVLTVLIDLMMENKLPSLFNKENINLVNQICQWLIPVKNYVYLLLGQDFLINLIFIIILNVSVLLIVLVITKKTYHQMIKNQGTDSTDLIKTTQVIKKRSIKKVLFDKEITLIVRLKEMLTSYLSVLIILPMISYLLFSVVNSVVIKLFGGSAIHIILPFNLMFMIILIGMGNNFSACLISKEQAYFNILKTFPVKLKDHITQKLIIATILLQGSLLITMVTLLIFKQINLTSFVYVEIITGLIGQSLIVSAINHDLLEPHFQESFLENANSASFIIKTIFIGIIVGFGCLMFGVFWLEYFNQTKIDPIYLSIIGLSLIILIINLRNLYHQIDQKMRAISV